MNMIESVNTCLTKYFKFDGVASRSEYWWFQLFYLLAASFGILLDGNAVDYWNHNRVGYFEVLFQLIFFVPAISVGCRRLHDIGKSGWWQLISLTIIGLIPLIYWLCQESSTTKESSSGYLRK